MKMVQLLHPVHGLCAQEVVTPFKTEHKIKYGWKKRYGKKFLDCKVRVMDDLDLKVPFVRPEF